MKTEIDYKKLLKIIVISIIVYVCLIKIDIVIDILKGVMTLFSPFVLGAGIAFVLNVIMKYFEAFIIKRLKNEKLNKLVRPLSILLSIICIVSVLAIVMTLVIPEVINASKMLVEEVPRFLDEIEPWINEHTSWLPQVQEFIGNIDINWQSITNDFVDAVKNNITGAINSTVGVVGGLVSSITNFVIAFFFAIYVLMNKEKLKKQSLMLLEAYVPTGKAAKIYEIASISKTIFSSFVIGQTIEAIILGALCALGMLIFGFPYAAMIGSLVGLTALIPIVGAFIGGAVGVFMIGMQDPLQAVFFLIFLLILQNIEGNLIYPKVVGSQVGLPPMWVLFAVTIGGAINGIMGMLIGVPIVSVLYVLLKRDVIDKLNLKQIEI